MQLLVQYLRKREVVVAIAVEDADALIIETAVKVEQQTSMPTVVVENDID